MTKNQLTNDDTRSSAVTDDRLAELDRKVALLADQVGALVEHLHQEQARRQRWEELLEDVQHLGQEAFTALTSRLDVLDQAGYATFARGGVEVLDRVVTSFNEDDIRQLGDNIVLILQTVKEMTQPEVMTMLQRAAVIARDEEPKQISLRQLLKRMNDPAAKRGLDRVLRTLQAVADTSPQPLHTVAGNTNDKGTKE